MVDESAPTAHTMQCMEVWGGTRAADNGVVMPGLDAWVFAQPFENSDEGGDIHYLSSCATGRVVRMVLADVAGHGASVAEVASRLRSVMRRYLNYVDQRTVVTEINREFAGIAELGKFATAVVVTCWTPTDEIALTNAGHPPPLHYQAKRRAWRLLAHESEAEALEAAAGEARNISLGIAPAHYNEHRLRLATGDLLMLYSDALIEARTPGGEMLATAGLLRLVGTLDPADPQRLIADLRAGVRAHAQTDTDDDDITIMVLRTNTLKPRGGLATGLKAGGRIAANLVGSLRPGGRFAMPEVSRRNIAGAFFDRLNKS